MRSRERKCDSPKPQNGGKPCDEKGRMDYKFCRIQKCGGKGLQIFTKSYVFSVVIKSQEFFCPALP